MLGRTLAHYRITAAIGAGGPPPLALSTARASYGEVSSVFAAKRLRRDHAEARPAIEPSGGGPKPSMRTR